MSNEPEPLDDDDLDQIEGGAEGEIAYFNRKGVRHISVCPATEAAVRLKLVREIRRLREVVKVGTDGIDFYSGAAQAGQKRIAELEATQEELLILSGATDSEEARTLPTAERLEIAIRSLTGANLLLRSELEKADSKLKT